MVIEEALKFGGEVSEINVNAIQKKEDSGELGQLKTLLEQMVKKIDTLEAQMSEVKIGQRDMTTGRRHYQYVRGGSAEDVAGWCHTPQYESMVFADSDG